MTTHNTQTVEAAADAARRHAIFIQKNLQTVRERIEQAALHAGRKTQDIRLIAVSKFHPATAVHAALEAGQIDFGENRIQEGMAKFSALKSHTITLHMIGPLQTNKVKDAVCFFDVIQSVDRMALAKALSKALSKTNCTPKFLIEINIGEEPQKAGILPGQTKEFLSLCRNECGLEIDGLMCIPPANQPALPFFMKMREIAERLDLKRLSMGMSQDYPEAIQAGATEIRVGTAIFGDRVLSNKP